MEDIEYCDEALFLGTILSGYFQVNFALLPLIFLGILSLILSGELGSVS